MMSSKGFKNHLAGETSPYLLQHVNNPVDWYPWSEEALTKAKQENKPILLSIGYSACHWCHVMAYESFEDEETAQLMNKFFVNIKVDREERPDLDKLYQLAHQMLTRRSGGWPLTVFLSADDLTPFFAGTYFPKDTHYNLPTFKDVLLNITRFYQEQPKAIAQQNEKLREFLARFSETKLYDTTPLTAQPLTEAIDSLLEDYDQFNGGFDAGPKFPQPNYLNRFLHHAHYQNDPHLLALTCNTLMKMAHGGIYDQIGGGFYRYSVDAHWHIPHFEKMLYDNGQLLSVYSDAFAATGDELFKTILIETGLWTIREMQAPEGGYYATLDADSEHHEGKFYRWRQEEIAALLTDQEYTIIKDYFNLVNPPNFEGFWHLHIAHTTKQLAEQYQKSIADITDIITTARQKLFIAREQRIRPNRDEKILTAWNGLMIHGMASAGLRLARKDLIESAQRAVDFIRKHLWIEQRLFAVYKDGQARFMAYLDDYAFLLHSLLALMQTKWRSEDLVFAIELADTLLSYYEDKEGGFFFTAHDHERILQRFKPFADEATPAGNGIAASALLRLGHLLGETRYIMAAEKTLKLAWRFIKQAPSEHHSLLVALEDYLSPPEIIILRGDTADITQWQTLCQADFAPQRMVLAIPSQATNLPNTIAQKLADNGIIAYICKGLHCSEPITSIEALKLSLKESR